jgi:hypothetical protein
VLNAYGAGAGAALKSWHHSRLRVERVFAAQLDRPAQNLTVAELLAADAYKAKALAAPERHDDQRLLAIIADLVCWYGASQKAAARRVVGFIVGNERWRDGKRARTIARLERYYRRGGRPPKAADQRRVVRPSLPGLLTAPDDPESVAGQSRGCAAAEKLRAMIANAETLATVLEAQSARGMPNAQLIKAAKILATAHRTARRQLDG